MFMLTFIPLAVMPKTVAFCDALHAFSPSPKRTLVGKHGWLNGPIHITLPRSTNHAIWASITLPSSLAVQTNKPQLGATPVTRASVIQPPQHRIVIIEFRSIRKVQSLEAINRTGQWNLYAQNPDSTSHLFGTSQGAGTTILTLLGGFHRQTQSLWLTDMAHHHLAIAFIFLVAGHMYRTNFGIGHCIKDLLDAHIPPGGRLGRGHTGLYDTINNSLHFQLGLALASLGVITSLVAQHMYSLPADTMPMTH
ncbi:hypothetical protein MIMGU_mgv1a018257mg, partial [Erythranthe guttata]